MQINRTNTLTSTYIGGPTLLLEYGGLRILTDPTFDPGGMQYQNLQKLTGPAVDVRAIGRIDLILLSHDQHADNLDGEGRKLLAQVPRVVTTAAGARRLGGNTEGLAPWQSVEIPSPDGEILTVTATPARHGPPGCEPILGDVIGFILSYQERVSGNIYISGDTVWYQGVAEVAKRFAVDIAILHLGDAHVAIRGPDRLTMNAEEGAEAARALRPRVIIPVHYEGWAHFKQPKAEAQKIFAQAGLKSQVLWLQAGIATPIAAESYKPHEEHPTDS